MSESNPHPDVPTPIFLRWLIPVGILIVAAVGIIGWHGLWDADVSGTQSVAIGKPAPRIDLVRISDDGFGKEASVAIDGKVTLLHFWGTWCGPCRMEYPELSPAVNRFAASDQFQFLSVSCEAGQGETLEGLAKKTNQFFLGEGIQDIAYADVRGLTRQSLVERLEQSNMFYPTSILIDQDAKIVRVWEGYVPGAVDSIQSAIKDTLN